MIFYESPHRIEETINDLFLILGDRKISIARELTKIHEEYVRGSLSEFKDFDFSSLKGEMVLIIAGNPNPKSDVQLKLNDLMNLGYELHVFQHGPHGYSLANEVAADGSSQVLNQAYDKNHLH